MTEGQFGTDVLWYHDYAALPAPVDLLEAAWQRIRRSEKPPKGRVVNLVFCSDYRIRKLNAQYRDKDKATDVLSFCFDDGDFLGEVYISLQRAAVQARRFGVSYESEVNRLFVHGVFHLLGYDHIEEKDRAVMEKKEAKFI